MCSAKAKASKSREAGVGGDDLVVRAYGDLDRVMVATLGAMSRN